jgi:hypothetical protein
MEALTIISFLIGVIGFIVGIKGYLRDAESGKDIKQVHDLLKQLIEKVETQPERYLELLPEIGRIIKANAELETHANVPKWIDILGKSRKLEETGWSDMLGKDVFVAGKPFKWSDTLKDEIEFHDLVKDSIYPEGEDTH